MHLLVPDMEQDLELDGEPPGLSDLLGVEGAGCVKRYLWMHVLQPATFSLLLPCGSKSSDACSRAWG